MSWRRFCRKSRAFPVGPCRALVGTCDNHSVFAPQSLALLSGEYRVAVGVAQALAVLDGQLILVSSVHPMLGDKSEDNHLRHPVI